MARRRLRTRFRTQAPREGTLIVAAVLWIVGFADVILGAFHLPNNLGIWALVVAGALLIIGCLVDAL